MICRQCGNVNEASSKYCSNCNAILEDHMSEIATASTLDFESNLGFSKPDSKYESPQVIPSISKISEVNVNNSNNKVMKDAYTLNNSAINPLSKSLNNVSSKSANNDLKNTSSNATNNTSSKTSNTTSSKTSNNTSSNNLNNDTDNSSFHKALNINTNKVSNTWNRIFNHASNKYSNKVTEDKNKTKQSSEHINKIFNNAHKTQQQQQQQQKQHQHQQQSLSHPDKLQNLSQYMYQGLNQDIANAQDEPQTSKKKDISFKKSLIGIVAGILITAIIFLYLGSLGETIDYTFVAKDAIEIFSDEINQRTYVFNANGDILHKVESYMNAYYNQDHTSAVLYDLYTKNCIYVNATDLIEFTSPVLSFGLSPEGEYFAYSVSGGLDKCYLKLYDVLRGSEIIIDNQYKNFGMINVLPGGKTISYVTYTLSDEGMTEMQSFILQENGEPKLVGKDIIISALSYDQNYIYYSGFNDETIGKFYVKHGNDRTLLSETLSVPVYFNKDYSEIIVNDGSLSYISTNGNPGQKLADHTVSDLLQPFKGIANIYNNSVNYYGIKSFQNKLLIANNNAIYILDEKYHSKEIGIAIDNQNVFLAKNGKSLVYKNPGLDLIKVSNLQDNCDKEVWVEQVDEFKISEDLSEVYYVRDNQLFYKKKDDDEVLVSENVSNLCINNASDTVFFLKDFNNRKGTIYYSINGSSAKPVEGGNNVYGIKEWNFGVIYQKQVNGTYATFYNTEGTDFTFIMDRVNMIDKLDIKVQFQY